MILKKILRAFSNDPKKRLSHYLQNYRTVKTVSLVNFFNSITLFKQFLIPNNNSIDQTRYLQSHYGRDPYNFNLAIRITYLLRWKMKKPGLELLNFIRNLIWSWFVEKNCFSVSWGAEDQRGIIISIKGMIKFNWFWIQTL